MEQNAIRELGVQRILDLIQIAAPDGLLDSGSRKVLVRAICEMFREVKLDNSPEEVERILASYLESASVLEEQALRQEIKRRLGATEGNGKIDRATWRRIHDEVRQDLPQDVLVTLLHDARRELGIAVAESEPKPEMTPGAEPSPPPSPEPLGHVGNERSNLRAILQMLFVILAVGALVFVLMLLGGVSSGVK